MTWYELIKLARDLGYTKEEVRKILGVLKNEE